MGRLSLRRTRDESGVVAIMVAVLAVLILMFAAFAVDIGMQVNRRHQLNDTLDAAAQAGAYALPGSTSQARKDALAFAAAHDPSSEGALQPNIDFWCVVASRKYGGGHVVEPSQLPATCYPGPGPYRVGTNYRTSGRQISCGRSRCAIPCDTPPRNLGSPAVSCNTIRVYQGRDVPFAFAPAGGILKGSTGNVTSVACKGSCGTVAPNPMDVVIVADRSGSMKKGDVEDMAEGVIEMLEQMTPSQQFVAVGAIGRSLVPNTPSGQPGTKCPTRPSGSTTSGAWVAVPFSDRYLKRPGQRNKGSAVVKGVKCLVQQSSTGTALASPMKAAARYLLGLDANNLSSLPNRTNTPTKVLILETDGQPNERPATGGSTSLNAPGDVFANYKDKIGPVITPGGVKTTTTGRGLKKKTFITTRINQTYTYVGGTNACNNLLAVANEARSRNILVVTVAYNLSGKRCDDSDPSNNTSSKIVVDKVVGDTTFQTETVTSNVRPAVSVPVLQVLAAAASASEGVPSIANNGCATVDDRSTENADGDYFFCAASGTDMGPIFTTALSQVSEGIKLIRLP